MVACHAVTPKQSSRVRHCVSRATWENSEMDLPSLPDAQLAEAIAAAIAAMPVGASHEDRLKIAINEVRRSRHELSEQEVLEKAKILSGL